MLRKLTARDIQQHLEETLGVHAGLDVIAHVNLEALGPVEGGAAAVSEAIFGAAGTVVMPAFTYHTQIVPRTGPYNNGMLYGTGDGLNARAAIFRADLPIHPDCGSVAEAFRREPGTLRSLHPILSFVARGPHARAILASQTARNPLGPIAALEARGGAVLLMGVDQRHNFALHLAEQRAGRRTFTRWALTANAVQELPNIPGCMDGFNAIWRDLMTMTQVAQIGLARCELISLRPLLAYAEERICADPDCMLCDKPGCLSCRTREA
jgi:aminoglycoside 3-N-acetyltransferase